MMQGYFRMGSGAQRQTPLLFELFDTHAFGKFMLELDLDQNPL